MESAQTVTLAILDGVGLGRKDIGDAVHLARTPHLDSLLNNHPGESEAHGTAVGLPSDGDMEIQEAGHNAMGAGRALRSRSKADQPVYLQRLHLGSDAWKRAFSSNTLHFLDFCLMEMSTLTSSTFRFTRQSPKEGKESVCVHILTDGR